MTIHSVFALLAMGAPQPGENPTGAMLKMIGPFVIMGFVVYCVMIRPQQQRQKKLNALMSNLKAGDKILTASGIVGVIVGVKEKTVSIRSADSKLEVLKSTISEITEKAGAEAAQA